MSTKARILTDAEKAIVLAARQPNGRPYFMPRKGMSDGERLAHVDVCDLCQMARDVMLSACTLEQPQ